MKKYKTIRGLFANADRWLKGALGATRKSENNYPFADCQLTSPELTCVCLEGAVRYVYPVEQRAEVRRKLRAEIKKTDDGYKANIIEWNDRSHRIYEDVAKLVRRAGV